ncbi:MAG: glycoside hydrolase family 5 protein [Lachnospiraceae bacterium]|nr:glycoside hydrolase family 5 protein [Lachnospiraceae bacterium]
MRQKKCNFLWGLMLACILTVCMGVQDVQAAKLPGAAEVLEEIGTGWNLGNTLDANGSWIAQSKGDEPEAYETAWQGDVTTETFIRELKGLGFNAIRIPVTWAEHMDSDGRIDKAWMSRVKEVVDYAYKNDMYVILNVHHDTGAGDNSWIKASTSNFKENKKRVKKLWKQIAKRFRSYDEKLMFEGFNEMLDENNNWGGPSADANKAVNKYNQLFVNAVRSTGGNNAERNLIVNTYAAQYSGAAVTGFKMPKDSTAGHLIAEVHSYTPAGFVNKNVTWVRTTDVFDEAGKKEIDAAMENLDTFFLDKGIPVIIGEWGAQWKDNAADQAAFAEYTVSAAEKYGVKCFYWDNNSADDFKLVDRTNGKAYRRDTVDSIMKALKG